MKTFKVVVSHEDREVVWRAFEALNNTNFIVAGPRQGGPADPADPVYDTPDYHEVWVNRIRARDEADARKRVEDAIPPGPGYHFEVAEEIGED